MPTPIEVKPRDGYKIWLRYEDGVEGEVDLSDVAGKGVFAAWDDRAFFESVRLDGYRAVRWGEDIDVCSDAIYMEITGKTVDEVLPAASGRGAIPFTATVARDASRGIFRFEPSRQCLSFADSAESSSGFNSETTTRPTFTPLTGERK